RRIAVRAQDFGLQQAVPSQRGGFLRGGGGQREGGAQDAEVARDKCAAEGSRRGCGEGPGAGEAPLPGTSDGRRQRVKVMREVVFSPVFFSTSAKSTTSEVGEIVMVEVAVPARLRLEVRNTSLLPLRMPGTVPVLERDSYCPVLSL